MAHTPWGPSQHSKQITRGMVFYSTAGHGGYHLSPTLNAKIPEYMRTDGWYEEDCQWAIVAMVFPEFFPESIKADSVESTMKDYFPEAYEKFTGKIIPPGESYEKDKQAFKKENFEKFVVGGAWGDWKEGVPEGMVGTAAHKESSKENKFFLVPEKEYGTRSRYGFVIDTQRHQEWLEHP